MSTAPLADDIQKPLDRWSDQPKRNLLVIYFAYLADDSEFNGLRVKVGRTKDMERRFQEHRAGHLGNKPEVFEPVCAVRGTPSDENFVTRYFDDIQWKGQKEIFHPEQRIVDYLRWLRDQYYAWVPDDSACPPIEHHPVVDSSLWLPSEQHRTSAPQVLPGINGPLNLPPRVTTADDFYTSSRILAPVRALFDGTIDLDPASHPIANQMVKATRFYGREENGLNKRWTGNVWLNPPFSEWKLWVGKILKEWNAGKVEQLCVLAATRTLTAQYFSPLLQAANAFCIMRGRIPFWGDLATSSPDDGHVVLYFGHAVRRFRKCFAELGTVYVNPDNGSGGEVKLCN